ncbi:Glucose-1-phosphate thymidylyltransferase 2 [compost metagenome]
MENQSLNVEMLGRGFAWLDTGTHESLLEASHFVHTIEQRQGLKVACLEEIAFHQGWLDATKVRVQAERLKKTGYGQYLFNLLKDAGR